MLMFDPKFTVNHKILNNIKNIYCVVTELDILYKNLIGKSNLEEKIREMSINCSNKIDGSTISLSGVIKSSKFKFLSMNSNTVNSKIYGKCFDMLLNSKDFTINKSIVLKVSKILNYGFLNNFGLKGYRDETAYLIDDKKNAPIYFPPEGNEVYSLMNDLLNWVNLKLKRKDLDPILIASIFHKQFFMINPFVANNGKINRLLTNYLLLKNGFGYIKYISIDRFFYMERKKYSKYVLEYGSYYDIKGNLNFTKWIEFFTSGILIELNKLKYDLCKKDIIVPKYLKDIIEYVKKNGMINDKMYDKFTDRAKSTRSLDFKTLVKMGVLKKKGKARATYYVLNTE